MNAYELVAEFAQLRSGATKYATRSEATKNHMLFLNPDIDEIAVVPSQHATNLDRDDNPSKRVKLACHPGIHTSSVASRRQAGR